MCASSLDRNSRMPLMTDKITPVSIMSIHNSHTKVGAPQGHNHLLRLSLSLIHHHNHWPITTFLISSQANTDKGQHIWRRNICWRNVLICFPGRLLPLLLGKRITNIITIHELLHEQVSIRTAGSWHGVWRRQRKSQLLKVVAKFSYAMLSSSQVICLVTLVFLLMFFLLH